MESIYVENLSKNYEKFQLKNVSFSLESGYIMGFIGANGAGKTTTLKSMLGLVQKNSGTVRLLGMDFEGSELEIKQHIGFMIGGVDYYAKTRIKNITEVVRRFYKNWDHSVYEKKIGRASCRERV